MAERVEDRLLARREVACDEHPVGVEEGGMVSGLSEEARRTEGHGLRAERPRRLGAAAQQQIAREAHLLQVAIMHQDGAWVLREGIEERASGSHGARYRRGHVEGAEHQRGAAWRQVGLRVQKGDELARWAVVDEKGGLCGRARDFGAVTCAEHEYARRVAARIDLTDGNALPTWRPAWLLQDSPWTRFVHCPRLRRRAITRKQNQCFAATCEQQHFVAPQ